MINPFRGRALSLAGPATDIFPVTPDDSKNLPKVAVAIYVETAGTVSFLSVGGETRQVSVGDFSFMPVGVSRVLATGTTATGIHAMVIS